MLINFNWNFETILKNSFDVCSLLEEINIKHPLKDLSHVMESIKDLSYFDPNNDAIRKFGSEELCNVCCNNVPFKSLMSLCCGHKFCCGCWKSHIQYRMKSGRVTNIPCMSNECNIIVHENFYMKVYEDDIEMRSKYNTLVLQDCIRSNPCLQFCGNSKCSSIFRVHRSKPQLVVCSSCNWKGCFECLGSYHLPTDCKTINKWLIKCNDDSETSNYIAVNTKDCTKCGICIEKNGGCNHMRCFACKHEFCWVCLGPWFAHAAEYYECSKFKEDPEASGTAEKAHKALKRYLFYFERWNNHMQSLKLEGKTLDKIRERINSKVMSNNGTWIDWQYLLNAADSLAKCRHTLQNTYPKAYYMENGPTKNMFEFQQAQLEAEIENLSWKIEHAETTDRGDLENQMNVVDSLCLAIVENFSFQ